jgi:hypothetical protein
VPVVVIPTCFIELGNLTPDATECRVQGRNAPEIVQELFQRFPALFTRGSGTPKEALRRTGSAGFARRTTPTFATPRSWFSARTSAFI